MSATEFSEPRALVALWLRRLGQAARLDLQLDSEGVCAVGHTTGIDCAIEVPEGQSAIYLRAPLMPWPPACPLRLALRCLTEQFMGLGTGGASFAIDVRDAELVLWQCLPLATLDEASFGDRLGAFIDMAARWRDEVRRMDLDSAGDGPGLGHEAAAIAARLA